MPESRPMDKDISSETWHACLLLPDGVGVRNFFIVDLLARLAVAGGASVLHRIGGNYLDVYSRYANGKIKWHEFADYTESATASLLRYSLAYSHMYWADTRSM